MKLFREDKHNTSMIEEVSRQKSLVLYIKTKPNLKRNSKKLKTQTNSFNVKTVVATGIKFAKRNRWISV